MTMAETKLRRILAHIDGRGRSAAGALAQASALAQVCRARLKVIDVVREPPRRLARLGGRSYRKLLVDGRREQLEELCAGLDAQGVPHSIEVRSGVPFVEVIRSVLADGSDLVVKATERRGSPGIFGSTDMSLLRKCPCPVLLLKGGGGRLRRLLAAVDPDPEDAVRDSLNPRIMAFAGLMRELTDASLDVAHAWQLVGEDLLGGGSVRLSDEEYRRLLRSERQARLEALQQMLAPHGLAVRSPHVHLLKGHPEAVLPEVARKLGADLLIMGTVGRVGLAGVFMGNTAEAILSRVDCSVLALKPEGFVSPVTRS
jgi:nucleotide-binding universal stress UspA family protein